MVPQPLRCVDRYHSLEEIERLVRDFETCMLPGCDWTHHAHLTVALWYLTRYPEARATECIRSGIQRYNLSRGLYTAYHETITLFYIRAIRNYMECTGEGHSLVALTNGLLNSPLGDKAFPLRYYSKERLMSAEARAGWIDPDLRPLE